MRATEFLIMTEIHFVTNMVSNDPTVSQSDGKKALKDIRVSNMNKLLFGHLNIKSLRNKFDLFSEPVKGSIDILMVSETKLKIVPLKLNF